jgi:hypothetical protein
MYQTVYFFQLTIKITAKWKKNLEEETKKKV